MTRRIAIALFVVVLLLAALLQLLGSGVLGHDWGEGEPVDAVVPPQVVQERAAAQSEDAAKAGMAGRKQILFGDLHVHTTYSADAFLMSLPASGGEGARPVSDACDFARHCSALDFWSINDHALAATPRSWAQTVDSVRQCNAVSPDPENPDVTAFLGWEWTQIGTTPETHYGHKNVILRDLEDGRIPTRPISAQVASQDAGDARPPTLAQGLLALAIPSQSSLDLIRYFQEITNVPSCPSGVPVRDLPLDCRESAAKPAELFAKLDDWGVESMVIPHGTSWGFYTPQGSAWDKQLGAQHDPERQRLVEVYSGHGNSEEFRPWREVILRPDGTRACPRADPEWNFEPSCWRAGEIIRARCKTEGEPAQECEDRAVAARQHYVDADISGHLTVPAANPEDWLDSGQCRDCFQPAFNLRPRSSVQYMMALRDFSRSDGSPADTGRFDFGFIAASDNHSARPGTGYKEYARTDMTEARFSDFPDMLVARPENDYAARSQPFVDSEGLRNFFGVRESERQSSFFVTGGLAAVHSDGRDRGAIWDALQRREVYGTSGPRILLWFDLLNPRAADGDAPLPMGSSADLTATPSFSVRAVGSFEQKPGCPDSSLDALGAERLDRLCRDECFHPSDQRRRITRIEVVRIQPQIRAGEPVEDLIEDPWRVYQCPPDTQGCSVRFDDPDYRKTERDTLYYVRAIEEPTPGVNAGNLRCSYDETGACREVEPCTGRETEGDCLQDTEQRAWSSPIFLQFADG